MIFNDYETEDFPGVRKAVDEEAQRRNLSVRMLDRTNAVLGGQPACFGTPLNQIHLLVAIIVLLIIFLVLFRKPLVSRIKKQIFIR